MIVHNSPYAVDDKVNPYLQAYTYVVTKEDVEAEDWVVMDLEEKDKKVVPNP